MMKRKTTMSKNNSRWVEATNVLATSKAATKKISQSRRRTVTTRNSRLKSKRVISKNRRVNRTMRVIIWCLMLMSLTRSKNRCSCSTYRRSMKKTLMSFSCQKKNLRRSLPKVEGLWVISQMKTIRNRTMLSMTTWIKKACKRCMVVRCNIKKLMRLRKRMIMKLRLRVVSKTSKRMVFPQSRRWLNRTSLKSKLSKCWWWSNKLKPCSNSKKITVKSKKSKSTISRTNTRCSKSTSTHLNNPWSRRRKRPKKPKCRWLNLRTKQAGISSLVSNLRRLVSPTPTSNIEPAKKAKTPIHSKD